MGYSRRFRFGDGKSLLHRVEYAQEFDIRLRARPNMAKARVAQDAGAVGTNPEATATLRTGPGAAEAPMPVGGDAAGQRRPPRPPL